MTYINLNNWRQGLKDRLPGSLKAFFQNNAKAQLLRQINTVLLVHGDRLHDLSNGSWRQLTVESGDWSGALATAAVE